MTTTRQAVLEIEDIAVLEALNSTFRLQILYQAAEPATVREMAERLGVPVTRLYYHVNALESVGVIRVVATRKSGARVPRVYQAVANRLQPGRRLLEQAEDPERVVEAALGAVLDGARIDARAGLTESLRAAAAGRDKPIGTLGRSVAVLSRDSAARLAERIDELVDEMGASDDAGGQEFAFSFVFYPMVGPLRGEV